MTRVSGLGFRVVGVSGFGSRVSGLGTRVLQGVGCRKGVVGCRVKGAGCRVWGGGCRCGVYGTEPASKSLHRRGQRELARAQRTCAASH